MLKLLFPCAFLALLTATAAQPGAPRTFYIDSAVGKDANTGLSETQAWKSLDKVNATTFAPGDRILFKAGTTYNGQLHPQGSGNAQSPIVIDRFGEGDKPLIAAQGKFHEALLLRNQEYWEVNNLQLSNTGPARETFRYGVRVMSLDYGTVHHIHLKNLYVHDVNGSIVKKDAGLPLRAWPLASSQGSCRGRPSSIMGRLLFRWHTKITAGWPPGSSTSTRKTGR